MYAGCQYSELINQVSSVRLPVAHRLQRIIIIHHPKIKQQRRHRRLTPPLAILNRFPPQLRIILLTFPRWVARCMTSSIGSTNDSEKDEDAPSSIMTNVIFDVETSDVVSRLRALEGELEMIDHDVSGKVIEVIEKWREYMSADRDSERYRFGGGVAPQAVHEPIFEVRSEILHQLLRKLIKLPRRQRITHGFSTLSGSLPLLLFKRRSLPLSKRYNHKHNCTEKLRGGDSYS